MYITRSNLYASLKAVLPFASCDQTRQHLMSVWFESDADKQAINIVATDGHTLAHAHVAAEIPDSDRGASVLFAACDLKRVMTTVKATRIQQSELVDLNLRSGRITIGSDAIYASIVDHNFPAWRALIDWCGSAEDTPVAFNPKYLLRAARAALEFDYNKRDTGLVARFQGCDAGSLFTIDAGAGVGTLSMIVMPRRDPA